MQTYRLPRRRTANCGAVLLLKSMDFAHKMMDFVQLCLHYVPRMNDFVLKTMVLKMMDAEQPARCRAPELRLLPYLPPREAD